MHPIEHERNGAAYTELLNEYRIALGLWSDVRLIGHLFDGNA